MAADKAPVAKVQLQVRRVRKQLALNKPAAFCTHVEVSGNSPTTWLEEQAPGRMELRSQVRNLDKEAGIKSPQLGTAMPRLHQPARQRVER
ncbi:MAG: hypothetical protein WBG50_22465 [Desulfomonilaceae bacterium]